MVYGLEIYGYWGGRWKLGGGKVGIENRYWVM
jgi:hypothetical protein